MHISPPIHSTALRAVEFIPPSQDAEKFKARQVDTIRRREQALDRHRVEVEAQKNAGDLDQAEYEGLLTEIAIEERDLNQMRDALQPTYDAMRARYPAPQVFTIAIPTSVEREQINSRLISLGITQVTQEMIRATMIEELFHQDWSSPGEELDRAQNEALAENHANFLDSVWMRQQAHDEALARWKEQEVERILDHWHGAPLRPGESEPPKIIGIREQSRMQLLVDRMMSTSQRLRDLAAANMDFGRRNAILLARIHVLGVNFNTPLPIARNPRTHALDEDVVLALREKVDDISWGELVTYIDELYKLDGGEEKNSDSLPEKQQHLTGSIEPSVSPASNGGSSTISSSTPAPAAESATTTGMSFVSTSGSDTAQEKWAANPSPTAEA